MPVAYTTLSPSEIIGALNSAALTVQQQSTLYSALATPAPYLLYDNFHYPVRSLVAGQVPTIGPPLTDITGPDAANVTVGNGTFTSTGAAGQVAYAEHNLSTTPGELGMVFSYDSGTPTPTLACYPGGPGTFLTTMFHAFMGLTGPMFWTYWSSSSQQFFNYIYGTPYSVLTAGVNYTYRIFIYAPLVVGILQDSSGNVIASCMVSDPAVTTSIGPTVFWETFGAGFNIHSIWARSPVVSGSNSLVAPAVQPYGTQAYQSAVQVFPAGIDGTPIGMQSPAHGQFSSFSCSPGGSLIAPKSSFSYRADAATFSYFSPYFGIANGTANLIVKAETSGNIAQMQCTNNVGTGTWQYAGTGVMTLLNAATWGYSVNSTNANAIGNVPLMTTTGTNSLSIGVYTSDRGRYGSVVQANGRFSVTGDAQIERHVLRGTGSSAAAIQLTSNGSAAGATNIINIPANTTLALSIDIMARDATTTSVFASYTNWNVIMIQAANAASTAVTAASLPTPLTGGTTTGMTATVAADTTNGGLTLTWTPPTGNTDTWRVVAYVRATSVQ